MCPCVCTCVCTLTVTSAQDFIAKKNLKKRSNKQELGMQDENNKHC